MLLGFAITKVFKMPSWTTPAIAFNNTTSLPLLLVQSLAATGILASIDSSPDVLDRAKSYFLVNAMIGNSLTFALGPRLLNGQEEDAPDREDEKGDDDQDEEEAAQRQIEQQCEEAEDANEDTSLLPRRLARGATRAEYSGYFRGWRYWKRLPSWAQSALTFLYQFLNAPLIGAALGALVGLVPALHTLFFAKQADGGYLNAWLTSALGNVGDLFAALQVIVVGVKLSQSLLRMKKGEANGKVPMAPLFVILAIRFVIWPAISISFIYLLATRTELLTSDPLLWFVMMLMPVGPPALKLIALADVNGAGQEEKMSIAKFLTVSQPLHRRGAVLVVVLMLIQIHKISYAISPLICFAVVGSLKASQAALGS